MYTYQAKHQAELIDRKIEATLKLADAARQRASVLRAEYALLNDPTRLAELTAQHLPALRPTAPGQFTNLAELDRRLPPVGPPPMPPGPVAEPPPVETSVPMVPTTPTLAPSPPPSPIMARAAVPPQAGPTPQANVAVAGLKPASPKPAIAVATNDSNESVATASFATSVAAAPLPQAGTKAPIPKPHAKTAKTAPATHAPRVDPFVTPVSSPESLARLAHGASPAASPSRTFSALGMAHSAMLTPATSFTPSGSAP